MEKYLYFRKDSTLGNDDDGTNGSFVAPVSSILGMEATSATELTLRFVPRLNAFAAGGNAAADADNLTDSVAIAIGTNKHKDVIQDLTREIAHGGSELIVVFDAVTSDSVSSDITGVTPAITAAQA